MTRPSSFVMIFLSVCLGMAGSGCKAKPTPAQPILVDTFERSELGPNWLDTSRTAKILEGKLTIADSYNHPVWLLRKLPRDVQIDFDASSKGPAGDLKIEIFGDGKSFGPDPANPGPAGYRYEPSGYEIVMGGWDNTRSIIGRFGEHDATVKAARGAQAGTPIVAPGQTYHFTITRRGTVLDWRIDGVRFLTWSDPSPLYGHGHEHLAFSGWQAEVSFDNLTIRPLAAE